MKTAIHDNSQILNPPTTTLNVSNLETRGKNARSLKSAFDAATRHFPIQELALEDLYWVLKGDHYPSPDDMRKRFPSLDRMKYREKWWVIDVGGGYLRVMLFTDFERGKLFIKHTSTHAEYDKLTYLYRRTKE